MQIKHNLLNKNTTANRVASRRNPVNLSLQPSLHLCKALFGDRTNKNSIVNRGSPICVRKRNPADCHHLFVWFCLWDSEFGFIIWFSRGSFGQPCYLPPSALQHNTFNIWSKLTCRVILLVIIIIDLVPSPHKTLCSTYEPTWHLESCLKCLFLPLQQDNTLNRWRKLASWIMIEICNSSTLQCNTFNVWRKLTCGVFFWNLSPLDPTKQYIYILAPTKHNVQHRPAWTSHLEPCLTGPFPTFANQYVEYMNKVEMSRHLYILNSCPSPEKQYLEHTKEWAFDIYNSVTLHCNTLNMWS